MSRSAAMSSPKEIPETPETEDLHGHKNVESAPQTEDSQTHEGSNDKASAPCKVPLAEPISALSDKPLAKSKDKKEGKKDKKHRRKKRKKSASESKAEVKPASPLSPTSPASPAPPASTGKAASEEVEVVSASPAGVVPAPEVVTAPPSTGQSSPSEEVDETAPPSTGMKNASEEVDLEEPVPALSSTGKPASEEVKETEANAELPPLKRLRRPPSPPAPLKCRLCGHQLRGTGNSKQDRHAMESHQRKSSMCLTAQGYGPGKAKEPCQWGCGRQIAAGDWWAHEQHSWTCPRVKRWRRW